MYLRFHKINLKSVYFIGLNYRCSMYISCVSTDHPLVRSPLYQ